MGEPQRQMMNKTTDEWANERNKKEKEKGPKVLLISVCGRARC